MVSDEDYDRVIAHNWRVNKTQDNYFFICRQATIKEVESGHPTSILLHRFIFGLLRGDRRIIDHKNNWLDNTRDGIRITDSTGNNRYRNIISGKILPKGVTLSTNKKNPYVARIMIDYKSVHLGQFSTPEEAHKAYCEAAIKYFGEYAKFG